MEAGFKKDRKKFLSGAIEPKDGAKNDKRTKAKDDFDDDFTI
jgi:hypothetical protein